MADPLSIAASVAGLIALSGSIYKIITDFVERAVNPPQSAHSLLLTVSEFRMVLNSVSDLVDNFLKYPPKRRALVRLDHLIICLTQTVLSFSELEKFVNHWASATQRSLWQRWNLNGQEERIARFTTRLQGHKTSISLVLNILQCESDTDAHQYQLSLYQMMKRVVNENKELRMRINRLDSLIMSTASSISTTPGHITSPSAMSMTMRTIPEEDEGASTIRELQPVVDDHPFYQYLAPRPVSRSFVSEPLAFSRGPSSSPSEPNQTQPFESELAQSWVYARVRRPDCDVSFTTSQPMSGAWSILSNLSLGQISAISVIALPITSNDVYNFSWYDRGTILNQITVSGDTDPVDRFYNIAVLGACEVGKSSLISTLCFGHPDELEKYSTLGGIYYTSILVDDVESHLRIADTPGLELGEYMTLTKETIRNSQAFVLVYSITDLSSYDRVRSLYKEIIDIKRWTKARRQPIVIAATKADLQKSQVMSNLNLPLFECSIESKDSVIRLFTELVRCGKAESTDLQSG